MSDVTDFSDLGLREELLAVLADLGYEAPTPIQQESIPQMLTGSDLLGQAATGTGKTAAFALPLLNRLPQQDRGKLPTALILVPTRELCIQVSSAIHRYGRAFDARTLPIYGGQPIGRQISTLKRGTDIVIGTPGRVLDHLNRRTLDLSSVATVVLDEADEMLDMGFAEDLDSILGQLPPKRQTVLFSATMPDRIRRIADRHLSEPITIEIGGKQQLDADRPKITQRSYLVPRAHKVAALGRLIDAESPEASLIFCRTRDEVDQLAEALNGRGYRAASLHGGMDQRQRSRIMAQLRNRNAEILVATDVAARGLDISHLSHVINFDVPSSPESYTHRIGRVGRGGKEGVALTLAEPREQRQLRFIQRITKQKIENSRVPSSADLRARWLDLTEEAVRDSASAPSEDTVYQAVLDNLRVDLDNDQIALAALRIAHDALAPDIKGEDIPDLSEQWDEPRREGKGKQRHERGKSRKDQSANSKRNRKGKDPRKVQRLFVSAGRNTGLRPQDLVGAIANETGLSGSDIGAIRISDRHATVEVPSPDAQRVIAALNKTRLKGNRVKVRVDRQGGSSSKGHRGQS